MKRQNVLRITVAILILLLLLLPVVPASADGPDRSVFIEDITITYPGAGNSCGFDVTVHLYGQIKVLTWYGEDGNPTRAKEGYGQWNFTWDAGYGHILTSLVQGPIRLTYLSATERILNIYGTNGLLIVPGYGPALNFAGHLTVRQAMDASGVWVDVEVTKLAGLFAGSEEDIAAACAYLGP